MPAVLHLDLPGRLYAARAVAEAAAAFAQLAEVTVERRARRLHVTLRPHPGAPADLADDFASHALALTVRGRR